jgi:hypothetical protein
MERSGVRYLERSDGYIAFILRIFLINLNRLNHELFARHDLDVKPLAAVALERELGQARLSAAARAPAHGRHDLHPQLSALGRCPGGHQLEIEAQRRRHYLTELPNL